MRPGLFGFLLVMWVLILAGGGIVVIVLGPVEVTGFGDLDWLVTSMVKATVALVLVVVWILLLSKIKNWMFRKEIGN